MTELWSEVSAELRAFRDLINDPPLRKQFMEDAAGWDALCHAMDDIDDTWRAEDKLAAVTELRRQVGLAALTDVAAGQEVAAALAGLRAARAEVEEQRNRLYAALAAVSLTAIIDAPGGHYSLEKMAAVARGGDTDEVFAKAGAADWIRRLVLLREQFSARALDDWVRPDR